MPLLRRPLLRAAMVGGAAYATGKRAQRGQYHEQEQDQQLAAMSQAPPPMAAAPPQAAPPAAPRAMSATDRIAALQNLKELLDSGVLTQAEFDSQKQQILQGATA